MYPICVPPPIPRNSTPPRIQLLRLVYATQVPSYRPLSPPLPPPPPPVSDSPAQVNVKFTPLIRILADSHSDSRLNQDSHSRLGFAARAVSQARCKRSTISATFSLPAFSFLARVHFQDSRASVSGSVLILSLAQDSLPRKYTFILAPHAPPTTRLALGRDSDMRTEGKGKRCKKYVVDGPDANAKGNASRGCKRKRKDKSNDAQEAGKEAPRSESAQERKRRMRRCPDDVRGGSVRALRGSQCEHATAIPPSRPLRRATAPSAPPRHATSAQQEGRREEGRNESQGAHREKEGRKRSKEDLGRTAHSRYSSLLARLKSPGSLGARMGRDRDGWRDADGAGEGVLCLVSLSLSFKEEDSYRTSPQTLNKPPAPPRRREQNAHQRLRLTQPCLNRIDGPLGWAALPAWVQEPARTAQSRRARRDEAPALGRAGEGVEGVEAGRRGGDVLMAREGRRRRRRTVVVLREALRHGQAHRRPEDDGERDEGEGARGDEEGAWAAEERAAAVVGWGWGWGAADG
ncbi:hypothetical protein DFH09DRAFT_1110875 [Mycena vulgaris]|nr:hypothetical protein DFH09DRAFT_1110875 [Mycena vulgaris]